MPRYRVNSSRKTPRHYTLSEPFLRHIANGGFKYGRLVGGLSVTGEVMSKGTPSMGKRQKSTHIRCRRCGNHSYHKTKSVCASCGYGATAKRRGYSWAKRTHRPKQ